VKHNDSKIGLQDLVEGFLFSLQAEGRAPRTIEYYRERLRPLLGYARDKGWSDSLNSLDTHRVRELLSWVGSRTCEHSVGNGTKRVRKAQPSTAWPYYRALRRLFNWTVEEGYLKSSPLATIHFKPPPEPPIEGYTIDELKRLLAVVFNKVKRGSAVQIRRPPFLCLKLSQSVSK